MKTDLQLKQYKLKPDSKNKKEVYSHQGFSKFTNDKGVPYSDFHKSIKGDV